MARRKGFVGLINQIAREQARAQRQAVTEYNRGVREHNRAVREQERNRKRLASALKQHDKELRQQYLQDRQQEVEDLNTELKDAILSLESILQHTLAVDDRIAFRTLKINEDFEPIKIPKNLEIPKPEPQRTRYTRMTPVKPVSFFEKMFHGEHGKNERVLIHQQNDAEASKKAYQEALHSWQKLEKERAVNLERFTAEYEEARRSFIAKRTQRNAEVDELESAYNDNDSEAIITYNVMVLERSEYPLGFPQEFRLAYVSESKELIIDYELPPVSVIPTELEYKFVKTRDEIQTKPRKASEIRLFYQDVLLSVCLRTIHEVLEADQGEHLSAVTFNGFVQTVDPTTGHDIKPYLLSVRVTKDNFLEINLNRVDKRACLRNLGAQVSSQPDECVAVKPIVDFNMVDRRFVEGKDVLAEIDTRPNLMQLNPFEFEHLVGNLFTQMGLDTRQTQTSRDGGVDVVAFDIRPVFGGKVVIQAKRYKNTVGVAAVRDLYGTMINEGASKGILVTTSGYGKDAFEFAKRKPIELIDGGGLLYLLDQHANIKAKIIMPQE